MARRRPPLSPRLAAALALAFVPSLARAQHVPPVVLEIHGESLEEVRRHMDLAYGNRGCEGVAEEHARELIRRIPDDLPALKVIADCTGRAHASGIDQSLVGLFQDSRVLSLLPEVLDRAGVKNLVPLLKEVETKDQKSVADFLLMGDVYERLGQSEEQMRALEGAVATDPDDARPRVALAQVKWSSGDRAGARAVYRDYIRTANPPPNQWYLWIYIAALAFPLPAAAVLISLCWLFGWLIFRRTWERLAFIEGDLPPGILRRLLIPAAGALIPVYLAFESWRSGRASFMAMLVVLAFVGGLAAAWPVISRVVSPALRLGRRAIASLFSTGFARRAAAIPTGWRVLIALATGFALVAVVPGIGDIDLKIAAGVLCAMVFFGTVGSLLVTVLRQSESLRSSLRWIGGAATIPFLAVYIGTHWDGIGAPLLKGRLPPPTNSREFLQYLILWSLSVVFALHLSKILADALVTPVRQMMENVHRIEQGDFTAKVDVQSQDELGELGLAVNRMADGLARREYVEKAMGRYLDKQVAERILSGNDVRIVGERKEAVVLFSDIRGFTRMSEKLSPEQVVAILNEYFESMVAAIRSYGGVIDKFIGDAIMAHWGVLPPTGDDARRAIAAALAMRDAMERLNERLEKEGHPRIGVGIGINAGEVVAGSIGSRDRMEFTVIGDVVNTAQRSEANAMAQQVLVTEAVWTQVSGFVDAEPLEPRLVKGKSEPVFFWAIRGFKPGEKPQPGGVGEAGQGPGEAAGGARTGGQASSG